MAEEERNDADKPRVRFGHRVRGERQKSNPGLPQQQEGGQQRRSRHRIGPKNRRSDQAEMALVPPQPQQPAQPQRRDDHPRGPHPGKPRVKGGEQNPSEQGGGVRRKRRRRKGRRPEEQPSKAPQGEEAAATAPAAAPSEAGTVVFRQVLPPIEDDLDEVPSGIFEPGDASDSDADDSEVDLDDDYEDPSDLPSESEGDVTESDNSAPEGEADPSARPEGQQREGRQGRDKKRRKKRRDRMESAPVDRNSGYWWAEQWVRSFEMLFPSNASRSRLAKGRTYARRGQVLELEVGPNGVLARVQGSRPRPYQVRLELNRLRRETWGRILHQLVGKAGFLAQLLEGHLPPEIEDVFFSAGARLFPHGDVDVRARCNCPDPVVPCKHVAALNYALADALQRDPFLLFAMRGKSRDQFLQDLREMRGRDRANAPPPPVDEDLAEFWRMGRLSESVLRPTGWSLGSDPARLLQSLGEPQLEGIREGLFLPMLEATYRQVAESMRRLPKDA